MSWDELVKMPFFFKFGDPNGISYLKMWIFKKFWHGMKWCVWFGVACICTRRHTNSILYTSSSKGQNGSAHLISRIWIIHYDLFVLLRLWIQIPLKGCIPLKDNWGGVGINKWGKLYRRNSSQLWHPDVKHQITLIINHIV